MPRYDDVELRIHHEVTGSLVYALLSGPRSQEDAESASEDFSNFYPAITTQQSEMSVFVDAGFELGLLDRACRENPEDHSIRENLVENLVKLSEDIHTVSINAK